MKKLNGGNVLIDLSNGVIDNGALTGVDEEFLSLYPLVHNNIKKNFIHILYTGKIIPCSYVLSSNTLTLFGVINNGSNGLDLITIECEYVVGDYDEISIDSISIETQEKEELVSLQDLQSGELDADFKNLSGDSIIENMSGYTFIAGTKTNMTLDVVYVGVVKNGNKITFVIFGKFTRTGEIANNFAGLGDFYIPASVAAKLYPTPLGNQQYALSSKNVTFFSGPSIGVDLPTIVNKDADNNRLVTYAYNVNSLTENTEYQFRFETTFLLSDNLAE